MKHLLLILIIVPALFSAALAKKVKFQVDMDTITPNANGIHITGDFQDEAGFPADWDPATTAMTQDANDPSIYYIIVDIPAFRKYEYKFVNGIFGYEVEFVPLESRVNYNFIDNRWIYLDSVKNDTTIVEPVIFATNAPAGKYLYRFYVDMGNVATISPKGVHAAGDFNNWDTLSARMFSFDGMVYEYIAYADTSLSATELEYRFLNGNTTADYETVPVACATLNNNRGAFVTADVMLPAICFSQCAPCVTAIAGHDHENQMRIFPNPMSVSTTLETVVAKKEILITDISGRIVRIFYPSSPVLRIERDDLEAGIYFIHDSAGVLKLIIE